MGTPLKTFRTFQAASAAVLPAIVFLSLGGAAGASERLASVIDSGRRDPAPQRQAAVSPTLPQLDDTTPRVSSDRPAVSVMVDRAKIIRLPERTQTVIVGNPGIADVSLQKNGIVVLTGKSYGLTNIIALDNTGAMLVESTVSVQASTESIVVVQRGMERESYSCTPRCQPSLLLGDSAKYFGDVSSQASQRNAAAGQK